LPPFQNAELVGQAGDEERVFFRVKDGERVVAEGEDGGEGGGVGFLPSENNAAMAEVQAIEKTEGEVTDAFSGGGGE
jgi:hypothetical protein